MQVTADDVSKARGVKVRNPHATDEEVAQQTALCTAQVTKLFKDLKDRDDWNAAQVLSRMH